VSAAAATELRPGEHRSESPFAAFKLCVPIVIPKSVSHDRWHPLVPVFYSILSLSLGSADNDSNFQCQQKRGPMFALLPILPPRHLGGTRHDF